MPVKNILKTIFSHQNMIENLNVIIDMHYILFYINICDSKVV